jgi:hypothetical protein
MKFYLFLFSLGILYLIQTRTTEKTSTKGKSKLRRGSSIMPKILKDKHKKLIVDIHNKYRNMVATGQTELGTKLPYATNMMQVYWYDLIAVKAQEHANKLSLQHSKRNARQTPFFKTGENIYQTFSTTGNYEKMDWERVIGAWFREIKTFESQGYSVDHYSVDGPKEIGHFTQLIWAVSYQIGCGVTRFTDGQNYNNLYVCQYGPVGNIVPAQIYNKSDKLECKCPEHSSCKNAKYNGLCCPEGACEQWMYYGVEVKGTEVTTKDRPSKVKHIA